MRVWRHFGVVSAIMSLSFATGSGQTAPAKPSRRDALVCHVLVRGTGAAMEVEIQTSGATVEPDTQSITGPDRIVVDFPGALTCGRIARPQGESRGTESGPLGIVFQQSSDYPGRARSDRAAGLPDFRPTRISATENSIVIKLAPGKRLRQQAQIAANNSGQPRLSPPIRPLCAGPTQECNAFDGHAGDQCPIRGDRDRLFQPLCSAGLEPAVAGAAPPINGGARVPPKPAVTVTFENGMLSIHSDRATLAQVLFEVHLRTHAEIAIPVRCRTGRSFRGFGSGPRPRRTRFALERIALQLHLCRQRN